MHFAIIGSGAIGQELAGHWGRTGHLVTMLSGSAEPEDLRRAAAPADAVVLAARPRLRFTSSRRDRLVEYRHALLGTVRTAARANRRLVFLSSMVVYGDGGPGTEPIDERTPATTELEPAAQAFGAAERVVLESPHSTVLRLPDVVGHPSDLDDTALLSFAHEHFGGAVPFSADALLYRVDYRDAAAAAAFVVDSGLTGVYNAVPDAVVPQRTGTAFDKLAADAGLPPLEFRGDVKTPTRPISSARLRSAGFSFGYG